MAVMDFPTSPTNGQVYGQYTFDSSKGAWRVAASSASTVVSSPTAPSSPVAGNLWYNTNEGLLFVYYADGDTNQWVEVKANSSLGSTIPGRVDALETADATTNRAGLVPVIPTSVAVGSGSATVSSNAVTVTGASSVSLNNCFSGSYSNYRIVLSLSASALGVAPYFRPRSAGADRTNANFYYGGFSVREGGTTGAWSGNGATLWDLGRLHTVAEMNSISMDIFNPFDASKPTGMNFLAWANDGSGGFGIFDAGLYSTTNSNDGFTIYASSGTIAGTIRVYGYR